VAIGTDLDGYIKPALPGLTKMSEMNDLQRYLHDRYPAADAEKICSGNAVRMLHYRFP
jgi:microsomal dipeptidase-like Zn-dependent dipeptidase